MGKLITPMNLLDAIVEIEKLRHQLRQYKTLLGVEPFNIELLKGNKGDKGDKGNKGDKGDKGDAFRYSDFTPEEIAILKSPATEAAHEADTVIETLNSQELLRINAEESRVSAEGARFSAENNRLNAEQARVSAEANRTATFNTNESARDALVNTKVADITTLQEDVKTIMSGNFSGSELNQIQIENLIQNYTNPHFLRKDIPDTAKELIKFLQGILLGDNYGIDSNGNAVLKQAILDVLKSPVFSPGLVGGSGFKLSQDSNGKTSLEIDKLLVRLKMIISELEVRKLSYVGGDEVYSSAGSHLVKVNTLPNGDYRCYMLADDGTTRTMNNWRIGDQAKCSTNNIQEGIYENVSNRYYWRLVVARGTETLEDNKLYNYVDLSNTYGSLDVIGEDGKTYSCVGYDTTTDNDIPAAEDDIVQLGNQIDTERQYAYIIYVSEQKRVDYAGIYNFDLASHEVELHSATSGFINSDRFEVRSASGTGVSSPIVCDRGGWIDGMVCGHYDRVSYNGSLWLCNVGKGMTTAEEPTESSSVWIKQIEKGENAKLLSIAVSSNVMKCNADFSSIEGQQIVIEAKVSNLLGNVLFSAIPYDDKDNALYPINLSGTGNTRTLSSTDWVTTYSKVKLIVQLGDYSDSITVYRFISTSTEEDYSVGGKNLLREFETQFDFNYWGGNGQRGTSEIDIYSIVLPIKYIIGSDIIPIDENGRGIEL